jgi:hypothetical protein
VPNDFLAQVAANKTPSFTSTAYMVHVNASGVRTVEKLPNGFSRLGFADVQSTLHISPLFSRRANCYKVDKLFTMGLVAIGGGATIRKLK